MCDDVPCTWLPAIAYQGLCATGSEKLLIPTVALVITQVLYREYAGCCAAVVISIC